MIHEDATADRLAAARIAVFGVWFAIIAMTPVTKFTLLPAEVIAPAGIMRMLPMEALLASESTLIALKVTGLALTLACVLGVRPWRPIALTAVLLILWHDGAMKSIQGYANHAQAAVLLTAVVLALAPAADALSICRRRAGPNGWRYGGPMLLSAAIVATTYVLIGSRRAVQVGVAVFADGSIERWLAARSQQYGPYDFDLGLAVLDLPFAEVLVVTGMLVVTVFEVLSLLSLRSARFRAIWLVVIVSFHIATLLLMNIFFWENLVLLSVLLTGSIDRLPDARRRLRPQGNAWPSSSSCT